MPDPILSLRALNRAVLARQMLLARHAVTPVAGIERLAGMQAQVPRPPFIGLWSRLAPFRRQDLITAIERRDIVRATMMRATIHLISRRDFLAWRLPLQPMLIRGMQRLLGGQLRTVDMAALIEAARQRFEAEPCTFASLRSHLKSRFPGLDERLMGYMVRVQLPLVQTPSPGAEWGYPANASFALASGWLEEHPSTTTTVGQLALRYLAAFGPASARDFQTWSGIQGSREIFEPLRPQLRTFADDQGRELFDLPKAPRPDEETSAPVRFLPEYDNLLLAHDDRRRIIAPEYRQHVITRNLIVPATFLVDGIVSGTWRAERDRSGLHLLLTPFAPLSRRAAREVEAEATCLLQFLAPEGAAGTVAFARQS